MNNQVDRRNFLKLSAAAGAGLALAPMGAQANTGGVNQKKMPERTLGKRTGIKVPVLSMGVMLADNPAVVRAAYDSGITFFDTAHGYQNGRNEEMLGEFFADKPRDSFYLATKIGEGMSPNAATNFMTKFETSMKRLRLSYVDILYLHGLDRAEQINYAPLMEVVLKLKQEGRIKFIGVSTHRNEPAVLDAAVANGNYDVVLTSYNYTQSHLAELNPAIDRAAKAGLGIVAMKTMAGGYLDRERTKKVNTRAALKWALQNPNIHTAIPGFTSFDMLEESLDAAANMRMTAEEKDYLSAANFSMYCQGCGICEAQCAKHLPIANMMRAYMYNYGYRSPAMAKGVIDELALAGDQCGDCASCTVTRCTAGFQVAQKVQDITRLQYVPQEFLA